MMFTSIFVNAIRAFLVVNVAFADSRPNILFILTDDQDMHLDSLEYMPNVQSQLIDQGTFFSKHYCHVSQCCPSRASLWRGQHAHNTNVTNVHVNQPGGGWPAVVKNGLHKTGLPVWLQSAGYNTYYAGKLYNGLSSENYCKPSCVEGWGLSDFLVDPNQYTYYSPIFQHNEGNTHDKPQLVEGYTTDIITNYTKSYIDDAVNAGKPFFAVAAVVAPHVSLGVNFNDLGATNTTWCKSKNCSRTAFPFPVPKIEYQNLYQNATIPRTPNFNPTNQSGVATVWSLEQLNQTNIDFLDEYYRQRLRALKSVDDMVGSLIQKLNDTGILNNTYIFYSADNGYHIGQHRLQAGKLECFEEDINVPLIIRGPDVGVAQCTDLVTGHIDLPPTFLGLANTTLQSSWDLDGQAVTFPLNTPGDISANINARSDHLHVEFWGPFNQEGLYGGVGVSHTSINVYKSLRIQGDGYNLMYSVWCENSAHELYDMSWDRYQMTNLHPNAPSVPGTQNAYNRGMNMLLGRPIEEVVHRLDAVVLVQKSCKTDQCRRPWQQLHPNGTVDNLMDALDESLDGFYANLYQIGMVGWEVCYNGSEASLYSLENEVPNWDQISNQVQSGDSTILSPVVLHVWLLCLGLAIVFTI